MPTTRATRATRLFGVALTGSALLALAACGSPTDEPAASASGDATASAATCTPRDDEDADGRHPDDRHRQAGLPARGFVDDDPSNGKGYESAVAYAIADELGFAKDKVTWVVAPFNTVVAPGKKAFDFDVNQVSISDERKQAVDFSSGYYDVRQAAITYKGSPIDGRDDRGGPQGRQARCPGRPPPRTTPRRTRCSPRLRSRSSTPTTSPCRP
jgi:polar amino acid transport system substrate-binding protein